MLVHNDGLYVYVIYGDEGGMARIPMVVVGKWETTGAANADILGPSQNLRIQILC